MPRNELRISGLLQAAIIALIIASSFSSSPASEPQVMWPYYVSAYAVLAVITPWFIGGIGKDEFSLSLSVLLGIVFALPLGVSAYWLYPSPYWLISMGYWLLVAAWSVHLVIAITTAFMRRSR